MKSLNYQIIFRELKFLIAQRATLTVPPCSGSAEVFSNRTVEGLQALASLSSCRWPWAQAGPHPIFCLSRRTRGSYAACPSL